MEVTFSAAKTMRRHTNILAVSGVVIALAVAFHAMDGLPVPIVVGAIIGTIIGMVIIRRLPLMDNYDIVIDDASVEGPTATGLMIGPRRRVPLSSIDLGKSQRSFWRGCFLATHTDEKIIVNYFCFTAAQMGAIKETISERQSQQIGRTDSGFVAALPESHTMALLRNP